MMKLFSNYNLKNKEYQRLFYDGNSLLYVAYKEKNPENKPIRYLLEINTTKSTGKTFSISGDHKTFKIGFTNEKTFFLNQI